MNIAELQDLGERLSRLGYCLVDQEDRADLYVLNTCTVTHVADRKSRQIARRLKRMNPKATVLATGCYVELLCRSGQWLDGVDIMVRQAEKSTLEEAILGLLPPQGGWSPESGMPRPSRTRGFVKVQDGCNEYCTFCTIPVARGGFLWSASPDAILDEVRRRLSAGHKEIVITGVHLGKYRFRQDGSRLKVFDILKLILRETDVSRLRVSSIEPHDFDPRLIELWADPRVCRHVHLALQSGCDRTLKRMRRGYTVQDFADLLEKLRAAVPDISITTDIIVGFPGETDEEFWESYSFAEAVGFSRIHVFPFSPRPGTPAAAMPDQVPAEVKRYRVSCFLELGARSAHAWHQKFVGRMASVLWEMVRPSPDGPVWEGYTDNYVRVRLVSRRPLLNTVTSVALVGADPQGVVAQEVM